MAAAGYLLDTKILLHLLRGNPLGRHIDQQFALRSSLATCVISVVTVGEMYSLARTLTWGPARVLSLKSLLDEVPWIDISDPAILDTYGQIDHFSARHGRPMGKNDLWIAATAHATNMTLLTTDKDFDHLDPAFITRVWIDPNQTLPA